MTWSCLVGIANGPAPGYLGATTGAAIVANVVPGTAFVCSPPVMLYGLTYGDWTFQVGATGLGSPGPQMADAITLWRDAAELPAFTQGCWVLHDCAKGALWRFCLPGQPTCMPWLQ